MTHFGNIPLCSVHNC